MIKKFLKFIGWVLLYLILFNVSTMMFNAVDPWLGIVIGTLSIAAAASTIMFYWGEWCLEQEGKKNTGGNL